MSRNHSGPNTFPALGRSDADTMSQEPGGDGPVTSDYVRHWAAIPGALISGFIQFTVNNQILVAWDDRSAGARRLVASGSPQGKIGGGSFGTGPDALLSAVRLTAGPNSFAADADALADIDLTAWTIIVRVMFEVSASGTGVFCGMKHSVITSGFHFSYDYAGAILSVIVPGSTSGDVALAESIVEGRAYTLVSRFDSSLPSGERHKVELFDEDGALLETQSVNHVGTTTDGDDFILHNLVKPIRMRKYAAFARRLMDAEILSLVANFQTDDLL